MRFRRSLAAALLTLTLSSCNKAANPTEARAGVAIASDVDAVMDLEKSFIAGWEAKDPSVKSLYAPDAVMVVPAAVPRTGPVLIGQAFDRFAANSNAAVDLTNSTTVVSTGGDMAFSHGLYVSRRTDAETKSAEESKGYYLLVYKKQPDGGWKVVQDVSSPLPDEIERPAAM